MYSGVEVATIISSIWEGWMSATARALAAASKAIVAVVSVVPAILLSLMPVRATIHSSEVSIV